MPTHEPRTGENGGIARRRPSLRFQLTLLGAALAALVALGLYAERDGDGDDAPPPPPASTTTAFGFPPAAEGSVCVDAVTAAEVERLVGRTPGHPVIEPLPGNCAWPSEPGNPRDAELFLIVEPRGDRDLATQLARDFDGIAHRVEPAPGIGDEAYFVLRRADPEGATGDEFVEGLHVHAGAQRVTLANGGRDVWPGGPAAVKERLAALMPTVLERVDALRSS